MVLALGIILHCILAALGGSTADMNDEFLQLSDEVLDLAEVANQYRPLRTIYMILYLAAAWMGTTDPAKKALAETRLIDYRSGVQGPSTCSPELELIEARFNLN